MPTLSIYVNDKIYQHLGTKPSKAAKIWIEDRYNKETGEELIELETIRVEHGLNWHDFILDASRLYNRDPQTGMDVD